MTDAQITLRKLLGSPPTGAMALSQYIGTDAKQNWLRDMNRTAKPGLLLGHD